MGEEKLCPPVISACRKVRVGGGLLLFFRCFLRGGDRVWKKGGGEGRSGGGTFDHRFFSFSFSGKYRLASIIAFFFLLFSLAHTSSRTLLRPLILFLFLPRWGKRKSPISGNSVSASSRVPSPPISPGRRRPEGEEEGERTQEGRRRGGQEGTGRVDLQVGGGGRLR